MLRVFPASTGDEPAVWVDLAMPSPEEQRAVEEKYGVAVPARTALREIETTSRLRSDGDTLFMSAPMIGGAGSERWEVAPTGFILMPKTLVTIRYSELDLFDKSPRIWKA